MLLSEKKTVCILDCLSMTPVLYNFFDYVIIC